MEKLTFNELPDAISHLIQKVDAIEKLLQVERERQPQEVDQWFDIIGLIEYLPDHPAKATIYGKVHERTIPFHKGEGQKQLRFLKSEIDIWLKEGKRQTIADSVDTYFKRK